MVVRSDMLPSNSSKAAREGKKRGAGMVKSSVSEGIGVEAVG